MVTFEVDPLVTELREVFAQATDFFDAQASSLLKAAARDLETAFRGTRDGSGFAWRVRMERPITTRESVGSYEPSGRGGETVVGMCCWVWELKRVSAKRAQIAGIASTKVTLLRVVESSCAKKQSRLCEWNFDIGEATHPGALVHAQLCSLGNEAHALSVPRFPSVTLAPTDVLDFLLGELFQEEWQQHASIVRSKSPKVAQRMRLRLMTLLQQQAKDLDRAPGLGMHMLKAWKPTSILEL